MANNDERLAEAKKRIEERKAYLAELNKVANETLGNESVQNRLQKLSEGKDEEDKRPTAEKSKGPLTLVGLTKSLDKTTEKLGTEGMTKDKPDSTSSKKDDKKDKKNENGNANAKADNKAQVLSEIQLPSGARIVEHANKWEIVSEDKNGKEVATDITDVMNKIDSFNKSVNKLNKENKEKESSTPDYTPKDKASAVESRLPNVRHDEVKMTADFKLPDQISDKDIPTFKPEDMEKLASEAITLADAGKLFKQVNDRNRQNESEKDDTNRRLMMSRDSGYTH